MEDPPQRSQTRRRPRKPYPFEPPKEKDWSQDSRWQQMLARGDTFFTYMTTNFDSMFLNDTFVKHLIIGEDGCYEIECYGTRDKEGQTKLLSDIQTELVPWIKTEHESGRLFEKSNWMPFRDGCGCSSYDSYMGYRFMFLFRNYYFQLSINEDCDTEDCNYCDGNEINTRFELVYWPKLREIGPENTIPDRHWKPH